MTDNRGESGGPDWALLLDLSELLFSWADVLLLVDECFVLLPFSSTELLLAPGFR